jgi:chromosome segregation ATPase
MEDIMGITIGNVVSTVIYCAGKVIGSVSDFRDNYLGRIIQNWSVCTICAAGIVGVTSGLVGVLMSSPIATAISIALFAAALFLGIFVIVRMKPERDSEEKMSEEKIKEFEEVLKVADNSLEDFDQIIEDQKRNIADLKDTKVELSKLLEDQKELDANFVNVMEENALELEEFQEKLNDKLDEQLNILENTQAKLSDCKQTLDSEFSNMSKNVKTVMLIQEKSSDILKLLRQRNDTLAVNISNMHDRNEGFQNLFESVKELNEKTKELKDRADFYPDGIDNLNYQMSEICRKLEKLTAFSIGFKKINNPLTSLEESIKKLDAIADSRKLSLDANDTTDDVDFLYKEKLNSVVVPLKG